MKKVKMFASHCGCRSSGAVPVKMMKWPTVSVDLFVGPGVHGFDLEIIVGNESVLVLVRFVGAGLQNWTGAGLWNSNICILERKILNLNSWQCILGNQGQLSAPHNGWRTITQSTLHQLHKHKTEKRALIPVF